MKCKTPQLQEEAKILNNLRVEGYYYVYIWSRINFNWQGFPKLQWYGIEAGFRIMIIELLGPNIEEIFSMLNKKFSTQTVINTAEQMVILYLKTILMIDNVIYS